MDLTNQIRIACKFKPREAVDTSLCPGVLVIVNDICLTHHNTIMDMFASNLESGLYAGIVSNGKHGGFYADIRRVKRRL